MSSYYTNAGGDTGGGGGGGYLDPYGNVTSAQQQPIVGNSSSGAAVANSGNNVVNWSDVTQQYQQYMNDFDEQQQAEYDERTQEEIDEEMQRELAEDAPWKKIQQNTFTRWANEHLKLNNKHIEDLQWDLSDGLCLIALVEVLSHKRMPRYNKKPMFRSQQLENVSMALDFLENVEHIKLVNIGILDILTIFAWSLLFL